MNTSEIINVILIVISVALAVDAYNQRQHNKQQVKIWMEQANGVQNGLQRIITDKWNGLYSSVTDVTNAVYTAHASAFALYQSLYDERVLSEKEYKKHQKKLSDKLDKDFGLTDNRESQKKRK